MIVNITVSKHAQKLPFVCRFFIPIQTATKNPKTITQGFPGYLLIKKSNAFYYPYGSTCRLIALYLDRILFTNYVRFTPPQLPHSRAPIFTTSVSLDAFSVRSCYLCKTVDINKTSERVLRAWQYIGFDDFGTVY